VHAAQSAGNMTRSSDDSIRIGRHSPEQEHRVTGIVRKPPPIK
jgi:hypothetical protein